MFKSLYFLLFIVASAGESDAMLSSAIHRTPPAFSRCFAVAKSGVGTMNALNEQVKPESELTKGLYSDLFKEFHQFESRNSDRRKHNARAYIYVGRFLIGCGLYAYVSEGYYDYKIEQRELFKKMAFKPSFLECTTQESTISDSNDSKEEREKKEKEKEARKKVQNIHIACCVCSGVLLSSYGKFRETNILAAMTGNAGY